MARFTAVIHKEDDMFVAFCPEIGTTSQGKTTEEALANLKEATMVYLEEFPDANTDGVVATFEVESVKA